MNNTFILHPRPFPLLQDGTGSILTWGCRMTPFTCIATCRDREKRAFSPIYNRPRCPTFPGARRVINWNGTRKWEEPPKYVIPVDLSRLICCWRRSWRYLTATVECRCIGFHSTIFDWCRWNSDRVPRAVWFLTVTVVIVVGARQITYETVGVVQMTFLRLLSQNAYQNITFTCVNSAMWYNQRTFKYDQAIKLLGDNEQEFSAQGVRPNVIIDGCKVRQQPLSCLHYFHSLFRLFISLASFSSFFFLFLFLLFSFFLSLSLSLSLLPALINDKWTSLAVHFFISFRMFPRSTFTN